MLICVAAQIGIAQNRILTDIVVLHNGSELEGYISRQSSIEGIDVVSYKTTIHLPNKIVSRNTPKQVLKKDLSPDWEEWLQKNDLSYKDKKNFNFYDFQLVSTVDTAKYSKYLSILKQMKNLKSVYVVNKTSSDWDIVDLRERTYHFEWKDIKEIKGYERKPNLLTGIFTTVRLKNTHQFIKGFISNQVPGSLITLRTKDGLYKDIKIKEISTIEKEAMCPDYDLFAQSPVIETVITNSGREYKGIITSQNYERDDYPFLIVLDETGFLSLVPQVERKEIHRSPNPHYKEIIDVELENDSLRLNYSCHIKMDTIEDKASLIFYTSKDVPFHKLNYKDIPDCEIILQANASINFDSITVIKLSELDNDNKYIKPVWEAVKKELKNEKTRIIDSLQWFTCDFYDTLPKSYKIMNTSPLGTKGFKFKIHSLGKYLIYLRDKKRGVLLDIVEK